MLAMFQAARFWNGTSLELLLPGNISERDFFLLKAPALTLPFSGQR
jgi:hypothetical protein